MRKCKDWSDIGTAAITRLTSSLEMSYHIWKLFFFLNDVSSYTSNNLERPCSQEVGLSADSCPLQNHNQLISLSNTFISSHFRAVDDNKREVFSLLWHYYVECWEDKKLVISMLKLRFLIQPSGKIKEGKTEFN